MKKDLLNLENEQQDDDFDNLFQDFLDTTTDADDETQDDENTIDEEEGPDLGQLLQQRKALPGTEVLKVGNAPSYALSVCVLEDMDRSHYTDGPVTVHIDMQDGNQPSPESFKCDIFTEDYYPMCSSEEDCGVDPGDHQLTFQIECQRIWLPGKYMLFVRDGSTRLVQLNFQLDEQLQTTFGEVLYCQPFGSDDLLMDYLTTDFSWHTLATLPGMSQIRQKLFFHRQLSIYNELRKELYGQPIRANLNFLICTRNGDLKEKHLTLFRHQVASSHPLEYVDCSMLYDPACNNPYEHLGTLLSTLEDQIVCLTNVGSLMGTGGKIIVKRLFDRVRRSGGKLLLWLCGTRQEITGLLDQFPSLKELYSKESWIEQQPYTAFELVQAFFTQLSEESLKASTNAKDSITRAILRGYADGTLSTWNLSDIRRIIAEDILPRHTQRALNEFSLDTLPLLEEEDVDFKLFAGKRETFESCLADLNEMVGLEEVKKSVTTMANNTRFFQRRRQQGLPTSGNVAHHCIFTGNPGTGKTTVARKLGRLYRSLGLLSRGEVITVDRTRLVGRYLGETEENMKAVLEEARGNVLFIDEAYTLYDGANDRKDFGARVIDSLLTVLSQPDPNMLIVFAGYEKEMDAMLNTNPGLMGRFPYKYKFTDYDADQLMEIALRLLKRDKYLLTDEATAQLKASIGQTVNQRTANFSNARWVEQFVCNGIIPAMADRLAETNSDDYQHIEAADVRRAYEKFNPKATELKPHRKVGFSA